jgi:ABC-2 type transport system permease protein
MKAYIFSKRNAQEILRDPINLVFGLAFPLVLLFLFSIINTAIPAEANNTMFEVKRIAPGVAMFGTVFMALFSGMLVSKDRTSSFLMRLFTSPMRSIDFIIGYTLPMIAFAAIQSVITLVAAAFVGLPLSANTLFAVLILIPISIMFVGIGLLCGSVMNDKAVGGICGALLTNVAGWLSGVWIPLDLIGGWFKTVSHALPFYHAAEAARKAIDGNYSEILPHLTVVLIYAIVIYALAVIVFRHKMSGDRA